MTATYTPRAGSKAEAAIIALETHGELSAKALSEELEIDRGNLDGNLKAAIEHGAIVKEIRDNAAYFRLPGDADATAAPQAVQTPAPKTVPRGNGNGKVKSEPSRAPISVQDAQIAILESGELAVIVADRVIYRMDAQAAREKFSALLERFTRFA